MSERVFPNWVPNAIVMNVSREMALDYGMVQPTPEEKAEREAAAERFRQSQVAKRSEFREAITELWLVGGVTAAVLDLHKPDLEADYPDCPGCDVSGYEGEQPDWPCRTVRLLAEVNGITLPDFDMPGSRYDHDAP